MKFQSQHYHQFITTIPTNLYFNNSKHLNLIRSLLKILQNYVNKIYQQIDHDFRNLTKLVSHFLVNYTIYIEFTSLPQKLNQKMHQKKERAGSNSFWPDSPARCGCARVMVDQYGPRPGRPRPWLFCRKAPELSQINTTIMRTISTISNFATKPSDIFAFTTGRSLETPCVSTRWPTA